MLLFSSDLLYLELEGCEFHYLLVSVDNSSYFPIEMLVGDDLIGKNILFDLG